MSSRTSLTFLQCDYFGSSLIRPLFSLVMCDVLLTVACPEHEVTWLWRRVRKNILGLYVLPFFRAPNPDAAQPQVPSLSLPPAAHPGFVQGFYGRGAAMVFGSMCGTAQLSWGFSRRFSGAAWTFWSESAPGSLGLVSKTDPWDCQQTCLLLGLGRCFQLGSQPGYFQVRKLLAGFWYSLKPEASPIC